MSRNTKEVSLIQHRSGNLAEMPKALHQAELGLAKDANRLFIGNAVNTILANRTEFPYQNLEILTEYSNLQDYFRYSYQNNITVGNVDRIKLKEFLPIVITCNKSFSVIPANGTISINNNNVELINGDTVYQVIDKINALSNQTNTYATVLQTTSEGSSNNSNSSCFITFVCLDSELVVRDIDGTLVANVFGFPTSVSSDISMPERKVTEKLDDTLHITDFGIKGDGSSCSRQIYNSLVEVYKNYNNEQFFRNVMFPAGVYLYKPENLETSSTIKVYAPFPMISNLHVHGEGIDRTIVKTDNNIDSNYILLNGVDSKLNSSYDIESTSVYGDGDYPENILIEDVTFESTSALKKLCNIQSIKNITFNRVKFKGLETTESLVYIVGKGVNFASNITFNECIFEGGKYGIKIDKYVENIIITNCLFKGNKVNAICIGDSTSTLSTPIRGVIANGNIINNSPSTSGVPNSYALYIGKNVTFSSFHQTSFEEVLFTNWNAGLYPRPYFIEENVNAHNFIDTLDSTTDRKKILKFYFSQPKWEYLDYLVNQSGKVVLTTDKTDADVTADGGLNIKETSYGVDVRVVGTTPGNLTITTKNDKDITLGAPLSNGDVTGNIQIKKTLQLNNNVVSNESGNDDITFKTSDDKVLVVDETGATPYETLISDKDNALVNVAYVKRQIIDTYEKVITYKDLENLVNGELPLIYFDPVIYGDDIYLKRITLISRTPFYKVYEYIDDAVTYQTGYTYYAGDIVKNNTNGQTDYAVVINNHVASGNNIVSNNNLQRIEYQTSYKSIKYIDITNSVDIVDNVPGNISSIVSTYYEDFNDIKSSEYDIVDIQTNNKFGYENCPEFQDGTVMETTDKAKIFKFCDRNYVLLKQQQRTVFTKNDLNNVDKVLRKYDEGYAYVFDLDKNFNCGDSTKKNPATKNYSNDTFKMIFYDENRKKFLPPNLIPGGSENDSYVPLYTNTQMNPGGKLLVRIEFLRNEVIKEEESS